MDEDQWWADKNHHCGSVSGLLSCVGGIAGEPSAVKAFMMWQKLIRVGAKSGPDVTLMNVVVCDFTDHLGLVVNIYSMLWTFKEAISDTCYPQCDTYHFEPFF